MQAYHANGQQIGQQANQIDDANLVFQSHHKYKSTWLPQRTQCHPIIHPFAEEIYNSLRELPSRNNKLKHNLSTPQLKALNRLRRRRDIILKPCDKGSGVCVLTPEQYTQEAERQLANSDHYLPLDKNIMPQIQYKIGQTIDRHTATGAVPSASANLLRVTDPIPAKFYLLPKVHKSIDNPPGRPIMAGNGNPTERIAEYVDEHIKRHIHKIPSYIKDTKHFLQICQSTELPPNSRIVTLDVSSLYTNIPHQEGIFALGDFMTQYADMKTTKMLKDFTQLILQSNIFEFGGQLYIQVSGTSMGSKIGPQFANIFMHWFETKHLPNAPVQPLIWKRYIDDIFAVFNCSEEQLQEFTEWINKLHPTIKLTAESNPNGVPFLDTFVSIRGNKLVTRPHTKPTDTKQYLSPSSCHPPHIIKSIPYSQALRIKRICTDNSTFENELENLRGFFANRGYNTHLVDTAFWKVMKVDVHATTREHRQTDGKPIPTALVIPFHPTNPLYQHAINLIWNKYEHSLNNLIGKPMVAFKRPTNLKEMLTRARYGPRAISSNDDPSQAAVRRPLSTFDKNQMEAPIKFTMFYCNAHHELHEEFDTLAQAQSSPNFNTFLTLHEQCGNTSLIPVEVTHDVNIKCTECKFRAKATSTKRTLRISKEMLNICHTSQVARLRKVPVHTSCPRNCKICKHRWLTEDIHNHDGTKYRLLPFDCKLSHVIYIIHCTLCNTNYVGMTTNTIKQRIHNHLSCIRNWRNTSVANHFITAGHDIDRHFRVGIIDQASGNNENTAIREGFWIHQLRTVSNGINEKEEMNLSMDYQLTALARHFHHSRTCAPYMTFNVSDIRTLHLKQYRRILLNPKRTPVRSAPRYTPFDQSRNAAHILQLLRRP
jgi:hypothetical protein